jgi:hypothetical protein
MFLDFFNFYLLIVLGDKAIVMFLSVLRHLKISKPTSQQGRKTNKRK